MKQETHTTAATATAAQPSTTPRTIVVATCGNPRKYLQSFTALRRVAAEHNARLEEVTLRDGDAPPPSVGNNGVSATETSSARQPDVPRVLFRFVCLHYDKHSEQMVLTDSPPSEAPVKESRDDDTSPADCALSLHVDVIIHKVASFGTPRAAAALNAWAEAQRVHYQSKLPIVLDQVAEVDVLNSRTALYALLDTVPGTCIARTYAWRPPAAGPTGHEHVEPVGAQSAVAIEAGTATQRMANGMPGAQWWIIKPNEGSGPAFTHHLVMWRTDKAPVCTDHTPTATRDAVGRPCVPVAVQKSLPTAAQPPFVVQELYTAALPIVLKVYCIGAHVFVKVSPTVKMLAMLRDGSSARLDVPVFMDSQNKALFTGTGLPTASSSQSPSSRRNSHTISLSPSGDYSATTPTNATARGGTLTTPPPPDLSSSSVPLDATLSHDGYGASLKYGVSTTSFESVVPTEFWEAWLAPGTPARSRVEAIAASLRGRLGLGLFGFDILLVPAFLAHPYQRARCPTGFGTASPTSASETAPATTTPPAPAAADLATEGSMDSLAVMDALAGECVESPSPDGEFWGPEAMFDLATGEPTTLLRESIPCVIDVNYFPGYKGWTEANDHMLALIAQKMQSACSGDDTGEA